MLWGSVMSFLDVYSRMFYSRTARLIISKNVRYCNLFSFNKMQLIPIPKNAILTADLILDNMHHLPSEPFVLIWRI